MISGMYNMISPCLWNIVINGELKMTNHIFVTSYPYDKERLEEMHMGEVILSNTCLIL